MGKYQEKITDNSLWLTATPSQLAAALPFYITETGHFMAERGYAIERAEHDSFLLILTVSGSGQIITGDTAFTAENGTGVILDCHKYHRYYALTDSWEFYWVHFNGSACPVFMDILYPNEPFAVKMENPEEIIDIFNGFFTKISVPDTCSSLDISGGIHRIFNLLIRSAMANEQNSRKPDYNRYIGTAIAFIQKNYSRGITIDDIINELHISKYHFIRLFRRMMGATPYSYLMTYRINMSKKLLRTTGKSIGEIAEACGFLDTGNFINQFKKHCGEKPTSYRKNFTV